MTTFEGLIDPTGATSQTSNNTTLAPRPESMEGLTLGLLDNTKPNATQLLAEFARELRERFGAAKTREYVKDYFGTPMKKELLEQITAECDVVITAVGDCGSCAAATVADGVMLERAGVPSVSVCSDSFLRAGQAMANVQGFKDFQFVAVRHPVASLDATQLRERVEESMPKVVEILALSS
jgi:hypothetical protein